MPMNTLPTMRLILSEDNFRDLVAGKPITLMDKDFLKIDMALADIGYERMLDILVQAASAKK